MRLSRLLEVITPTVDGDILTVLGRADGPFSGRQIHRLAGRHSEAGIRKALDRLVEQGIVTRQRVGNTHLHSLNQHHLAAAIRALARPREKAFELMGDALRAWPHPPALAAVFGSAARQQEALDSDIDVLLIPPAQRNEEAWQQAVSSFTSSVSKATGNDVRVLELTTDELWAPGNEALRQGLQKDTVILLGNRHLLTRGAE